MPKAGLFAGEVTQAAPEDGAATLKQKGFQWMEYGNTTVPKSGRGYSWTQYNYYGPPDFLHPFRNTSHNEWTQSIIFTPAVPPSLTDDGLIFQNQVWGESGGMSIRRRPISGQLYFASTLSSRYDGNAIAKAVAASVHEISIDHPTWNISHWFWMAMSYDSVAPNLKFWIRNLTLAEEASKAVSIVWQAPIEFDAMNGIASICGWGGTANANQFLGALSQLVIHNKYIDLDLQANRDKFCCLDGYKNVGERGEDIFGEVPLVFNERAAFPEEAVGTVFIGDPPDFWEREQFDIDENLPPIGTCP